MNTTTPTPNTSRLSSRLYPTGTTTQRAVLIPIDAPARLHGLPAGVTHLQNAIGYRLVDVISLDGGIDLWVDEEGLLQAAPVLNLAATLLAHAGGVHTVIFGTAIALSVEEATGETLGLSSAEAELVLTTIESPSAQVLAATAATITRLLPRR